jgi:hypothetical protein
MTATPARTLITSVVQGASGRSFCPSKVVGQSDSPGSVAPGVGGLVPLFIFLCPFFKVHFNRGMIEKNNVSGRFGKESVKNAR